MSELRAENRTNVGKHLNSLRKEGLLPAVLYPVRNIPPKGPSGAQGAGGISNGVYGEEFNSQPISVPYSDFVKVYNEAGETGLITLKIEGGKTYNVLIYDVAKDPLTLKPVHADFYAVRMDKPIEAKVPLEFIGESPAVKNEGGILVKVLHELEVKALPKDLPHEIKVDISRLEKFADKILVKDLVLPAGVTAHIPAEEVVALVEPPRSEEELEELVKAEAPAALGEVKTEREVKTEEKEAKAVEKAAEAGESA